MRIVKAGYEILSEISEGGIKELQLIEKIGRVCYKSEDKITDDGESAKQFVRGLINRGHEAMLEHSSLSVRFIGAGWSPQQARSVLPNSLKTEITLTGNYREWRHFFNLRACDATGPAHPQMKEVAVPLLREIAERIPVIFDDLEYKLEANE